MNVIKRLFLLLSLFTVIMPIGAMEQGDNAKEGFFAQLWNFGKENPIVASFGVAASLLGVYAGKHYLQSKRNQALFDAAREGSVVGVQAALARGADIEAKDNDGDTPLLKALFYGHLEVAKYLISCGADIEAKDNYGDTPLLIALHYGHLEVAKYLISRGANIKAKNKRFETALHYASRDGRLEVVRFLVALGADIEAKSYLERTPLHIASNSGQLEIVKYLISVGADIEVKDKSDITPLHIASGHGHVEIVKYLVSKGADVEAKCDSGQTALHYASRNGQLEVTKYLISIGADIEAKDVYSNTALHIATMHRRLEVVKYLVAMGANIEAKNANNDTPLYNASFFCDLEVVKYLLSIGANIDAKCDSRETAFDIAMNGAWRLGNVNEIVLALIQRSHFITPNMHTEESQKRLQATMHIAKTFKLPKDLGKKILSFVPEDLVSADHAKVVFNYGSELKKLVPHCPLRWFNKIYQDTYDSEKPAFLEKVVPVIVEYRLGKVKELLAGKTSQDPVIASIIDSDSVAQHREAITMHVTNGILGIEEEPEHREE